MPQDQVALLVVRPRRQEGQLCLPVAVEVLGGCQPWVSAACSGRKTGKPPWPWRTMRRRKERWRPLRAFAHGNRYECAANARDVYLFTSSLRAPSITATPRLFLRAKKVVAFLKGCKKAYAPTKLLKADQPVLYHLARVSTWKMERGSTLTPAVSGWTLRSATGCGSVGAVRKRNKSQHLEA